MQNKKIFLSVLALALCALLVLNMTGGAWPAAVEAASSSELEGQLSDLEDQNEKLDEEIQALRDQMSENLDEMASMINQKDLIDREIALLYQQQQNLNTQISAYALLIADKQEELDRAEANLADLRVKSKARIRAMEENGELNYWSVLFQASTFMEMLDRMAMMWEIEQADRRCLQELDQAAKEVAAAKETLETEKESLQQTRSKLDELEAQQEAKRQQIDELLIQMKAKDDEFREMMEESEAKQEALMEEMANLESAIEDAKYQEWLATSRPDTETGGGNITWLMPCRYSCVTDTFGVREYHPVTGEPNVWHLGIDLAGTKGTPIVATRSGYVSVAAYQHGGAGWYVQINHGDGYRSIYMHMTHYIVSVGQYVEAGQVIGYMGTSGGSTGVHLHFGISYNGVYKNPANYIYFY